MKITSNEKSDKKVKVSQLVNFEKCPKCGNTKSKFTRCPSCRFCQDESLLKKVHKMRPKAKGNGQKYTKEQTKQFKAKNKEIRELANQKRIEENRIKTDELKEFLNSFDSIARCDVSVGLGVTSKLNNKNHGKFGVPKDRTNYSPDALINKGWTKE